METKVNEIFKFIIDEDLLDDRREYDVDDLKTSYDLSFCEASELFAMIQTECNK